MLHFGMNMPFYLMALYGSILIAMVFVLRALLRSRLPKFVFPVLWGLVLLRFLIPFSVSIPLSMPVPVISYESNGYEATNTTLVEDKGTVTPSTTAHPGTAYLAEDTISIVVENAFTGEGSIKSQLPLFTWEKIMPIIYVLGLFVTTGILGWQKYGYARKLRDGFLVEHNETINTILRSMDMGHVLVFTSDAIATPLACGLLNPCIYLPTQMDFQNTTLLRHVLVHETMHIRRKDNWMKTILLIVLCLNWYNPLVWLMAVCLVSDLEAACDAAVLRTLGGEERKDYASSLLAMALTGRHTALLYSAFSKTEVEKRVKNILRYRKATVLILMFTFLFLTGSMVAFAAVGQAPFMEELTPFCASDRSRWGVRVTLARDAALGKDAEDRAEKVVFAILIMDSTDDPKIIEDRIRTGLAEEFGVEKGAFNVAVQLCLSRETLLEEYAAWGITPAEDGSWMYQGEQVRAYADKMLGSYQSREEGTVDISVQRDEKGEIISVTALHQGDPEYDERTRKLEKLRWYHYGTETTEQIAYVTVPPASGNAVGGLDDSYGYYEYYLTEEELIADIEQGYIFKVDTTFEKPVVPYVSQGNWPFYVHEDNTVNLEIAFSDLLTKGNKNIFPGDERIEVKVVSPDGRVAYNFVKVGNEITEDTSIQEQISVTPGEWELQVSFAYVCGKTPAHLRIAAAYDTPSAEDIRWLKAERMKNKL